MKKMVVLLLVLAILASVGALAESVPSKTTGDLIRFEVVRENLPAEADFFYIRPIEEDEVEYQRELEICQGEIVKLAKEESVVDYFTYVKDPDGADVDLKEMLGAEQLNVYEYCPFVAGNYDLTYGNVRVRMLFSTPYEVDERVAVLIGFEQTNADGTISIFWTAYEGIGVATDEDATEEQGCIEVELDPDIVLAVQEKTALLAIVSK